MPPKILLNDSLTIAFFLRLQLPIDPWLIKLVLSGQLTVLNRRWRFSTLLCSRDQDTDVSKRHWNNKHNNQALKMLTSLPSWPCQTQWIQEDCPILIYSSIQTTSCRKQQHHNIILLPLDARCRTSWPRQALSLTFLVIKAIHR